MYVVVGHLHKAVANEVDPGVGLREGGKPVARQGSARSGQTLWSACCQAAVGLPRLLAAWAGSTLRLVEPEIIRRRIVLSGRT